MWRNFEIWPKFRRVFFNFPFSRQFASKLMHGFQFCLCERRFKRPLSSIMVIVCDGTHNNKNKHQNSSASPLLNDLIHLIQTRSPSDGHLMIESALQLSNRRLTWKPLEISNQPWIFRIFLRWKQSNCLRTDHSSTPFIQSLNWATQESTSWFTEQLV